MSDQNLQIIEQKTILFYEDEITAVVVDAHGRQQIYVPLRPICEYLGLSWSSQLQRIRGDAVLADEAMSVLVSNTDIAPTSRRPNASEMICLPIRRFNEAMQFLTDWATSLEE